jgi:FkbM family methyltransferase
VVTARESLATLLSEAPQVARERAAQAFDRATEGRPVVLVGAGNLGRRIAGAMIAAGSPPIGFADGGQALHDTSVCGIPVVSVEKAAAAQANATFVVTIWGARSAHRIAETEAKLRAQGARYIAPFAHLLWKYPELLPHYAIDLPESIILERAGLSAALDLMSDEASRLRFVDEVRARLTGRFDLLGPPVPGDQYLVDDLYTTSPGEVVFDGGAFDGDSLRDWLRKGRAFARWIAIEPDPHNLNQLSATIEALPRETRARVRVVAAALGAAQGSAILDAQGVSSRVSKSASGDIPVTTIDAIATAHRPTFVKLDIEGAEPDALRGASHTMERDRPVLAVCVYHRQRHLWEIPLVIGSMLPGYDFFLRPHGAEGWDLVLYAVPRERRV